MGRCGLGMTRRGFLRAAAGAGLAMGLGGCLEGAERTAKKDYTNFVIIFTDDQGYADLGCFGAQGFSTPNIDRLAREGMRFTDFHVAQAVCSASRAALLTGCYSNRVGVHEALMPYSTTGLNPQEETLAELLRGRGYTTCAIGKWHLGYQREFLPLQHGFDEFFGLPYSNDMWPMTYDCKPREVTQPDDEKDPANFPPLGLIDGNETVDTVRTCADQDRLTTRYTQRAVEFIERNRERPFLLYLAHSMPHVPLGVSGKFAGSSAQGKYGDVIQEIDWSTGEVTAALRRCGLEENTLVIYTSDNGPWLNFGNHAGSAYPLREGKGNMWEGGARVPCVMRWPGRIGADRVCDELTATIDILPTLAEIAGAELPARRIDGVSLLGLLRGEKGAKPRREYYYYYGEALCAVRRGKWKLFFPHDYRSYEGVAPGRDGLPSPYAPGRTELALYDLKADIGERENVADRYPEVVRELEALGERAREDLGDSLTGRTGKNVRPAGQAAGG